VIIIFIHKRGGQSSRQVKTSASSEFIAKKLPVLIVKQILRIRRKTERPAVFLESQFSFSSLQVNHINVLITGAGQAEFQFIGGLITANGQIR